MMHVEIGAPRKHFTSRAARKKRCSQSLSSINYISQHKNTPFHWEADREGDERRRGRAMSKLNAAKIPVTFDQNSTAIPSAVGIANTSSPRLSFSPIRWEDEPGKPRFSCTTVFPHKTLELPPRLLVLDAKSTKLEASLLGREQCLIGKEFHGYGHRFSPQRGQIGDMVLRKRELKQRGFLGLSGRRASKSKIEENSVLKIKRNGNFSTLTHLNSHIWGAIYHGLKAIVPVGEEKVRRSKG